MLATQGFRRFYVVKHKIFLKKLGIFLKKLGIFLKKILQIKKFGVSKTKTKTKKLSKAQQLNIQSVRL